MSRKQLQVIKANQVIEASYRLSTIEQRVILSAVAQIPKGETISDQVFYEVDIDQLIQLGTDKAYAYKELKEAARKLRIGRIVKLIDGTKELETSWIQAIQYDDTNPSVIGIKFSNDLLPYLNNLSKHFTKYNLNDIAGMSSSYAIRIYELVAQYRSIGKRTISITDLRVMLALENEYKLFADLKRNVIEIALRQINEHSPILIDTIYNKKGRKIDSVTFLFKEKAKAIDSDTDTIDMFTGLTGKQIQLFAKKLSEYPKFNEVFEANIGESMEEYRARIASNLANVETKNSWIEYLKAAGYLG